MHLLRGNIGAGIFGMGDAFKNGGIMMAPILTVIIGFVAVHCQHTLVCMKSNCVTFSFITIFQILCISME